MNGLHLSFGIAFDELRPFIDHWASLYKGDKDEELYDPHIGKRAALRTDWKALHALFKWKNGGSISQLKLASVRANYFQRWTDDAGLDARYLNPDDRLHGGAIWNIFYLHCRNPKKYPIYDQHVYRAMIYLQDGVICTEENDLTPRTHRRFVYETYTRYRQFIDGVSRASSRNIRTTDRALHTFGRFLKLARPFV
jgi:hypothetical protein